MIDKSKIEFSKIVLMCIAICNVEYTLYALIKYNNNYYLNNKFITQ